jgi:hypothetical protein
MPSPAIEVKLGQGIILLANQHGYFPPISHVVYSIHAIESY